MNNYGLWRVLEPKGAVPVSAWKLDNGREIREDECRVALRYIHVEWDSFQQYCSECSFDEEKIKARIITTVNRRGKLHNPFTGSGGVLCGVVEKMGTQYMEKSGLKEGDIVVCNTTLTAIPLHIDEISAIDYQYGQLEVRGYAVLFESTSVTPVANEEGISYTLAIMDESGSPYNVFSMAKPGMSFLVIGRDLISIAIYIHTLKKAIGNAGKFTIILDEEYAESFPGDKLRLILEKYTKSIYLTDLTKPIEAAAHILGREDLYDFTVNCEDLSGAEILAVMLTRNKGRIYFTGMQNNFTNVILASESMGKEIFTSALDQYSQGCEDFAMGLIEAIRGELDDINEIYQQRYAEKSFSKKRYSIIRHEKSNRISDFVYASPITEAMVDEALNVAGYDCNVILQGETGTGKEMILNLIHQNSVRKGKPCIKVNCATIQESLAESEFFGYEKGAFTGAQASGKTGYFEKANGGILFLDEIGALSLNIQSKLLRVLQESQFYRVGGAEPVNVNVRVICANNIPLRQLVRNRTFREDLYYRLNICTISIPPLRERKEDIGALSHTFLQKYCQRYGEDKELDSSAIKQLAGYDWPGNVRELENFIHKLVIHVRDHIIRREDVERVLQNSVYEDLYMDLQSNLSSNTTLDFNALIESQEKRLITFALKQCASTRKAAEFLNMTQAQLMRKKQKYGL